MCVCVCVWLVNGMLRGVSLGLCTYILSTPAGFRTVGLLLVDDDNWLRGGGGREVNIRIIDWNKLEDSTFCTVTVERFRSSLLLSPVQKETTTKLLVLFVCVCTRIGHCQCNSSRSRSECVHVCVGEMENMCI